MQIRHLTIALAALALLPTLAVEGQKNINTRTLPIIEQGVGPAISGSIEYTQIPLEARKFIDKHFRGLTVAACEKEFASGETEITMSDGTEIDFDAKGRWIEIDAPDGMAFDESLLRRFIPDRAYRELRHRKLAGNAESVKREKTGYEVELAGGVTPNTYHFNKDGRLLRVDD